MKSTRHHLIRALFDEYIDMYASRNDLLTARFSKNFCGYTGGGNFLVDDRDAWINITRQDFAQVPGRIEIERLDLKLQDLCDDIVVATALFHIRLPMHEENMAREYARLTLIFRLENNSWEIVYSGISIPDQLVRNDEVYPIKGLLEQNQSLQRLLDERTSELNAANQKLMPLKNRVRQYLDGRLSKDNDEAAIAKALFMSIRTLVRRLHAEGTSFLQIKDQLRRETTLRLLNESKKSVEDIAVQIGFESLTAFHRAFKAWTGSTPLAYRHQALRQLSDSRPTLA